MPPALHTADGKPSAARIRSVSVEMLSPVFQESLAAGLRVRMKVSGRSMAPFIRDGAVVELAPFGNDPLRTGDILLVRTLSGSFFLHRVSRVHGPVFYLRGDAHDYEEGPFTADRIVAKAESLVHGSRALPLDRGVRRWAGRCWHLILPLRTFLARPRRLAGRIRHRMVRFIRPLCA